ncbi:MAG: siroheme synthase CysG [Candidatus Pelagadaptatus aseana]|uniref:siroheme synthase CysG n=1 Tax=Candidatus Pelagadaptatus aseana TaxID=3120508 RepID=UPI0039B30117
MKYLPLGLKLEDKPCLVIGGGAIALRKCKTLMRTGADIELIAPEIEDDFAPLIEAGLKWYPQTWSESNSVDLSLDRFALIIAATNDRKLNDDIAKQCKQQGLLVNVASDAEQGNLLLPAIIERQNVTVALHTDGQSPTITRYLKQHLEAFIPADFGRLSAWAESWRKRVAGILQDASFRRRFWHQILSSPIKDMVLRGDSERADAQFQEQLKQAQAGRLTGQVFLVGAGPGDPDLLTVKALKLIQQAEVVLYDRLVSEDIMSLLPRQVEKIYVGKRKADHSVPQPDINQLLVDLAKQGKQVLRLKGGDPFIFGRGGEELELLARNGVSFQVVPGITAASGCSSYAGIPLTHRDHSQSVRFVTGHLKSQGDDLDWASLAKPDQTLVFYMGLGELPNIMRNLQIQGASPDLPVAIIEKGTTPEQRVTTATVSTISDIASQKQFKAPTLVIVGTVVALHDSLRWQ